MSVRLRLNSSCTIPVCVQGILPDITSGLSGREVGELLVWKGNQQLQLCELFEVSIDDDEQDIVWQGDLTSVHWIGQHLSAGSIVVEGNAGRHTGSQMRGGSIQIQGDAGDYLGCEMSGGSIRVSGNAANWVGAAYPGTKSGTNGGTVVVMGNAGSGVGSALRRGTICVCGNVEKLVGWNMLAGTIILGGRVGRMAGKGMVRGSLLLPSTEFATSNFAQFPPSFTRGGQFRPAVLDAIGKWLQQYSIPIPLDCDSYQLLHGDHLKGGRGEVFIPVVK